MIKPRFSRFSELIGHALDPSRFAEPTRARPARRRAGLQLVLLEDRLLYSATPVGVETLVNQLTTGNQATDLTATPAVAIDSTGNFVAVWTSDGQDGDGQGVFGRRFADDGTALGNEFRINGVSAGDQTQASVAMDDDGNFVVTWTSANQDEPGSSGVYARRYDATGAALGGEFRVNSTTAGDQRSASVTMDDAGNFVVVWTSDAQDGDGEGIFGQRFNATGATVGPEFQVNTTAAANQSLPRVAANAFGDFVVTWTSENQDGDGLGIFGQRFAAGGARVGSEFQVNATSLGDQVQSTAALDNVGNLAVAWTDFGQDGDGAGVFARRFSSTGAGQAQLQVNDSTSGDQIVSSIAMDGRGNFFVIWESFGQDTGGTSGVYARQFTAQGVPQTGEFLVNTTTAGDQRAASAAIDDAGRLVALWSGNAPGDADGVAMQLFNMPNTPPVHTVPGGQSVLEDGTLVFSAGNGNLIAVSDADAGTGLVQVTLAATHGQLTLSSISGLAFTDGDGVNDATMTFTGSLADINSALDGLAFRADQDFSGSAMLLIDSDDLGGGGSGGRLTDSDAVAINVSAINDAPLITTPVVQNGLEDTPVVFSTGGGNPIVISDVDAGNGHGLIPFYFGTVANPSVLSLDLWANYNTIGVRLNYSEHSSLVGTTVEGTLSVLVGGQWVDAHDFVKDVDQQMLVSKIFGLSEGQTYTIRVSYIRRDANAAILEQHVLFGTTTTQSTPTSGFGGQIWIAPNGNDANPGTYLLPMRTLAAAAAALPLGGYLMLKDGDYFFDQSAGEHEINDVSGAIGQYYTLMAENPGQARILGYQAVNGTWNSYGNGIYWIDAPQLYDVTAQGQFGPNHLVDATTGRLLYTYRSLTTDNPGQFVYAMTQHPEAGWYYDFATRRLYVKLESGAAPAAGQVRASDTTSGVAFANSSYWIVDGIHFEQFGRTILDSGASHYRAFLSGAVNIHFSDHIVVRNSTFRHTSLTIHDIAPSPSNILIENNTFSTDGLWDVFYQEPFHSSYWQRIKNQPLEIYAVQAIGLDRGLVIRNNTFDGFATSVNLSSAHANYVGDVDIHHNASVHHMDDVYEADSSGPDGGNINTAIFNNTSDGGLTFVSLSSFRRGPLWIIGNHAQDSLSAPIKAGQQLAGDPITNSTGWALVYNNTFVTDAPSANTGGSSVWTGNLGHGNMVAMNNIFVGTTHYLFNEASDLGAHRAPILFQRNLFYTSYSGPLTLQWAWENLSYTSEDAMDAAAARLEMTDNLYGVNPFPTGFGGPLNAALIDQGVAINGITNVAVDGSSGQNDPIDLGAFTSWVYPSGGGIPVAHPVRMTLSAVSGTITLASLAGLSFITGDGAADSVLVFSGGVADINAALNGLRFAPAANFNGTAQLQLAVDDLGNTGVGGALADSRTIDLFFAAADDGPVPLPDGAAGVTGLVTSVIPTRLEVSASAPIPNDAAENAPVAAVSTGSEWPALNAAATSMPYSPRGGGYENETPEPAIDWIDRISTLISREQAADMTALVLPRGIGEATPTEIDATAPSPPAADESAALAEVAKLIAEIAASVAPRAPIAPPTAIAAAGPAEPFGNSTPAGADPYGLGVGVAATVVSGAYLTWCLGQAATPALALAGPVATFDPLAAVQSKTVNRGRKLQSNVNATG